MLVLILEFAYQRTEPRHLDEKVNDIKMSSEIVHVNGLLVQYFMLSLDDTTSQITSIGKEKQKISKCSSPQLLFAEVPSPANISLPVCMQTL